MAVTNQDGRKLLICDARGIGRVETARGRSDWVEKAEPATALEVTTSESCPLNEDPA